MIVQAITSSALILSLFFAGTAQAKQFQGKTIGIIAALDSTIARVLKQASLVRSTEIAERSFKTAKYGNHKLVLVRSPMGKVNNALTTQLLISHFSVNAVISISPAGALNEHLNIGDIIIAREVYQHDFGTWKPYGFLWSKTPVPGRESSHTYNSHPSVIPSVPQLRQDKQSHISEGILLSGDQFIASRKKHEWLQKKFHADAVDMGAAAIVQACFSNNVPVYIIRIITDHAGLNARAIFSASMPGYRTDINISQLVYLIITSDQQA